MDQRKVVLLKEKCALALALNANLEKVHEDMRHEIVKLTEELEALRTESEAFIRGGGARGLTREFAARVQARAEADSRGCASTNCAYREALNNELHHLDARPEGTRT